MCSGVEQSDSLRGDDVTQNDKILQFDWLMTSHDYIYDPIHASVCFWLHSGVEQVI